MTAFADVYWTSADGLALYARDYPAQGDAQLLPVICLHGLTRNSRDFEMLGPWLAERGHRVLVPEMRGRGRSAYDPVAANYVPQIYAGDVIALLRSARIERAIFVGTSMGGIVTAIVATLESSMVAAAILNDVGPEIDPRGIARITSYVGKGGPIDSWAQAADYVAQIHFEAFPDFGPADWMAFARRSFRDEDGTPRFDYDPAIARPVKDGKAAPPDADAAWAGFANLAAGRPLLVLRGGLSDILSPATVERMKRQSATVDVVEIDRVGHAPTLDEAQSRAAIAQWLDRLN